MHQRGACKLQRILHCLHNTHKAGFLELLTGAGQYELSPSHAAYYTHLFPSPSRSPVPPPLPKLACISCAEMGMGGCP